jgi:hypothetical protein
MNVGKPGSSYSYTNKTGAIAGITSLKIKIAEGGAEIRLKTGHIDLSGIARTNQTLTVKLAVGSYSSTAANEWGFRDPMLAVQY